MSAVNNDEDFNKLVAFHHTNTLRKDVINTMKTETIYMTRDEFADYFLKVIDYEKRFEQPPKYTDEVKNPDEFFEKPPEYIDEYISI